ncbi:MAG: CoA transferase [Alphaproteobacteria bacterium]|jgi:crotonobetainyl-CoA:carnitine CoA-transferase CaiB-like acyl-CoA transferase|nr:CoA transferase [Alphaproteobacteria bacterium]MDP6814805.1 CoA transferase [Alphaproteobacteria bacterium]
MKSILEGIVVVDLTQVIAGPACTRLMAELGAEVIKVEMQPDGDPSRFLPTVRDGRSGYYVQHNLGKKSICVDLRRPEGLEVVKSLLAKADLLVENFSPGTIDRLDLGWPVVRDLNPSLIMCSISAFGQAGPLRDLPGYDYIAQAYAGVSSMIGEPDGPPALPGLALGDIGTGICALATINGALFWRERNGGQGQYLDVALLDYYFHCHELNAQLASLGGRQPLRAGSHHGAVAPMGIYRARGGYIVIAVLERQWPRLCAAIGRPELELDPRFTDNLERVAHRDQLTAIIEDWMQSLPDLAAALARLEEERVPAAPVLTVNQAMAHPHLLQRGTVRDIDDAVLGAFQGTGNPLGFSTGLPPPPTGAPHLGEHNAEVLKQHLGLADADIARLANSGVLAARESV